MIQIEVNNNILEIKHDGVEELATIDIDPIHYMYAMVVLVINHCFQQALFWRIFGETKKMKLDKQEFRMKFMKFCFYSLPINIISLGYVYKLKN
jgi:hypothetical protein